MAKLNQPAETRIDFIVRLYHFQRRLICLYFLINTENWIHAFLSKTMKELMNILLCLQLSIE
jgi:hypothetical protein